MWNFRTDKSIKKIDHSQHLHQEPVANQIRLTCVNFISTQMCKLKWKDLLEICNMSERRCDCDIYKRPYVVWHIIQTFCIMPIQYTTESKDQTIFGPIMKITVNKSVYSITLKQEWCRLSWGFMSVLKSKTLRYKYSIPFCTLYKIRSHIHMNKIMIGLWYLREKVNLQ